MEQAQVRGGGLAGAGRRAVRQAVAEGGSDRDVLRRLVEVLATLSLVNAAEQRELTATVFKTYLVPWVEPVAEAMAEAGRFYHEAAGAIKDRPEAERAEAHEQLGPPFVHVWVACAAWRRRRSGARARVDCENVLGGQRGEELASATGGALAALAGEAVQEDRGQGRVDAHRVLPRSGYSPTRDSTGSSAVVAEGESGSTAPSRLDPSREKHRSPGTDAGEVERLGRRLEAVSQRMADLLRRGVLETVLGVRFPHEEGRGNKCRRLKQRPGVGHVAGRRRMKDL